MRFRQTGIVLCCMLLAACSPTAIKTERFTDRDLSGVRDYAWHSPGTVETGSRWINQVALNEMIREEIIHALDARGLSEVPAAEADILIGYRAHFQSERTDSERQNKYHGSGDPFDVDSGSVSDSGGKLPGAQPARIRDYDEGVLIVTAYDADTRERLWEGRADALVPEALGEGQRRDDLRKIIGKLFARFPSAAGRDPASGGGNRY